ncbi:hypothetical protein LTA6_002042 [Microbacterium sp. LTA6]|uniref:hypothetical protein n=1 Tax=unclassified Microbacterium TaxID=2609290 RepID=UPI0031388155
MTGVSSVPRTESVKLPQTIVSVERSAGAFGMYRLANLDVDKTPITGVTVAVYNAERTDLSSRSYHPRGGE